jgi:hypothetical protein
LRRGNKTRRKLRPELEGNAVVTFELEAKGRPPSENECPVIEDRLKNNILKNKEAVVSHEQDRT